MAPHKAEAEERLQAVMDKSLAAGEAAQLQRVSLGVWLLGPALHVAHHCPWVSLGGINSAGYFHTVMWVTASGATLQSVRRTHAWLSLDPSRSAFSGLLCSMLQGPVCACLLVVMQFGNRRSPLTPRTGAAWHGLCVLYAELY